MGMKYVIGIDPGKSGAIAALTPAGGVTLVEPLPIVGEGKGSRIDACKLHRDLDPGELASNCVLVVIERVGGHMGDAPSRIFEFGRSLGAVESVIALLGIRHEYVEPQRWQAALLAGHPRATYSQRKKSACVVASQMFPDAEVRRQYGDAMLIAEYARRRAHALNLFD